MLLIKKKRIFLSVFSFIIVLILCSACEWINPDEQIPSFIRIEAINLTTDYYTEGTASHKITDAWVYVDDDIIGGFEMPAVIPVLKKGVHKITIKPGIQLNGTASTRAIYPFYNDIVVTVNLVEDQITDLGIVQTKYNASTKFAWIENFEQAGISIESTSKSDTVLQQISNPDKIFEGWSGIINLDANKTVYEGASHVAYDLPKNGSSVFLELNYKTNNSFIVGLFINNFSTTVQQPVVVVNKSDIWKKIYINFTTVTSREVNALNFKIFIGAIKEDDVDIPEILIDNIKLVHF